MNYWLVKSEPDAYSWDDFVRQGKAVWDGVRNYQARNNLASMRLGDPVLFYHSVEGKEVVGLAKVSHEAYPDPTIPEDPRWVVVELEPVTRLSRPVSLQQIKAEPLLQNLLLVRQSRLSVVPVSVNEFECILALGS
ncbi:EVE domain-containing protein [Larkinella humicola]|uniref:EVE domain-containing protein n=1 Tax=Larkinella humicola TaxID=2607654 RepID=A0A5N1JMS2_9BACT|nr:EVE domain-containing protein [Larkinella humicola]KAA9356737.1 EVE domain-containing protein [Larkinella humicola]